MMPYSLNAVIQRFGSQLWTEFRQRYHSVSLQIHGLVSQRITKYWAQTRAPQRRSTVKIQCLRLGFSTIVVIGIDQENVHHLCNSGALDQPSNVHKIIFLINIITMKL